MAGSYLLLARTSVGLRVRASLENPPLARASGISTTAIYGATFAFGAALAGLAGALIVPVFSLFADLGTALPDPGLRRGHGRRRRLLHRTGGGRRRRSAR